LNRDTGAAFKGPPDDCMSILKSFGKSEPNEFVFLTEKVEGIDFKLILQIRILLIAYICTLILFIMRNNHSSHCEGKAEIMHKRLKAVEILKGRWHDHSR
jgi:hypothetical protein